MQCVILAGGYAKRLWPLTRDTPKPLLDVGGKTVLGRILDKVEAIDEIESIIVSTNAKFETKFKVFLEAYGSVKPNRLVVEPSMGEEGKLGSIGGLRYLIDQEQLGDDMLILGGDNLFEFDLQGFIDDFRQRGHTLIALKKMEDRTQLSLFGVCAVDDTLRITDFVEKPEIPPSAFASTALYCFTKADLHLIREYLDEGNSPDAMGSFITWLIHKSPVYGHVFGEEWIDIGSKKALLEARKRYRHK